MSFSNAFKRLYSAQDYTLRIVPTQLVDAPPKRKPSRTRRVLKWVAVTLLLAFAVSFLAAFITAKPAHADVLSDLACVQTSNSPGTWSDGNTRYQTLGGFTEPMSAVRMDTPADALLNPNSGGAVADTSSLDYRVTALEKYGTGYPVFTSWTPAFADGEFTFTGVGPTGGLGQNQLSTGSASPGVSSGTSELVTSAWGDCLNLSGTVEANIANLLAVPARLLITFTTTIFSSAADGGMTNEGSLLHPLAEGLDDLIAGEGGLRDALFIPFLIPIILIGAIWVIYSGIVKRQALRASLQMLWLVVAVALGTVFLAQPSLIAQAVDGVTGEVQGLLNDAIPISVSSELCEATGDDASKREASCVLWEQAIFEPWAAGQFGSNAATVNDPRGVLENPQYAVQFGDETVQAQDFAQFELDRQSTGLALQSSETAYSQLAGDGAAVNGTWAGGSGNQITAAVLMNLSAIAASIVPLILGGLQVIYQLMTAMLVLISPVFFLLGIIPDWGTRILKRYAELLVGLLILRVTTAIWIALYFTFYSLVAGLAVPIGTSLMLVALIGIGTLIARHRLNRIIGEVDFGGNKWFGIPGGKLAATSAGVGAALVGGGLIGGAMAAKQTRALTAPFEGDAAREQATAPKGSPVQDVRIPEMDAGKKKEAPVVVSQPAPAPQQAQGEASAPQSPPKPTEAGKSVLPTPTGAGKPAPAAGEPAPTPSPRKPSGASAPPFPSATAAESVVKGKEAKDVAGSAAGAAAGTASGNPLVGAAVETGVKLAAGAAGDIASGGESAVRPVAPRKRR